MKNIFQPIVILFIALLTTLSAMTIAWTKENKQPKTELTKTDLYCLTRNAYYEAKGDSQMSQIAVTHVVFNRLHAQEYPGKICDVIYQKNLNERRNVTVCQFSWYCDKRMMGLKINEDEWTESLNAVLEAVKLYYDKGVDITQGSKFYHAYYVSPNWKNLEKVTVIGSHIYYKPKEEIDNDKSTRWPFYEKVVLRTY